MLYLIKVHGFWLHPESLEYALLPDGAEEDRWTVSAQQLKQLPHLRKVCRLQAEIFYDDDHYMARRATGLGLQ